jgi:hydrogenase/urease accessory protein HupE
VHLRLPAIEPGVKAFVWALLLSLYIWGFLLAVGVDKGTSTVIGLVALGAIFLCVRVYGESEES